MPLELIWPGENPWLFSPLFLLTLPFVCNRWWSICDLSLSFCLDPLLMYEILTKGIVLYLLKIIKHCMGIDDKFLTEKFYRLQGENWFTDTNKHLNTQKTRKHSKYTLWSYIYALFVMLMVDIYLLGCFQPISYCSKWLLQPTNTHMHYSKSVVGWDI